MLNTVSQPFGRVVGESFSQIEDFVKPEMRHKMEIEFQMLNTGVFQVHHVMKKAKNRNLNQFMMKLKWVANGRFEDKRAYPLLNGFRNMIQRRKLDAMKEIKAYLRLKNAVESQNVRNCSNSLIWRARAYPNPFSNSILDKFQERSIGL